jgi:hypothetical protein
MMYICKFPFNYKRVETGDLVSIKPGEEVTDFLQWPYAIQKAHLSIGWVEKIERPKVAPVIPEEEVKEKTKGRHSKNK